MGRFCGGCASRRKSRSEIDVRVLAPAIVAIMKSPCHQDRDSFDTISRIDIMGSGMCGQTFLAFAIYRTLASARSRHWNAGRFCFLANAPGLTDVQVCPNTHTNMPSAAVARFRSGTGRDWKRLLRSNTNNWLTTLPSDALRANFANNHYGTRSRDSYASSSESYFARMREILELLRSGS